MAKRMVFWGLFLLALSGTGQDIPAIQKKAWDLARDRQWKALLDHLNPHLFPPPSDPVAGEWYRLYALAQLRTGDLVSAGVTLDRLEKDYSRSPDSLETRYLRGEWLWGKGRLTEAWNAWNGLPAALQGRVSGYVQNQQVPPDSLRRWAKETGRFPLRDRWLDTNAEAPLSRPDRALRVGLVLPFGGFAAAPAHPLADFYRGFSLAHEVVSALDSSFDLQVFDSKGSEAEINRLIGARAFDGLDVVVGPFKASLLSPLLSDAEKRGYSVWSPLSHTNPESNYPGYVQVQPAFSSLATRAFEKASALSPGRKVAIVFGVEKSDSLMAAAYREEVRKMGREVVLFRKVGKNSAANLTKYLVESGLDSTGHLFVANNEPLVRVQVLSAYGWTKAKYPVIVFGKWLEAPQVEFEEFDRLPFYFLEPDLTLSRHPEFDSWRGAYLSKWGRPPSWLSWKGFDLAYTLATGLYGRKGRDIRRPLVFSGKTSEGYQFGSLRPDNERVPLYRFQNGQLVPADN